MFKEALEKSASGKRIVFLGLNTDPEIEKGRNNEPPSWLEDAAKELEEKEKVLIDKDPAYVFVTNIPYHRNLDSTDNGIMAFAHGFKIDDFAKPGRYNLITKYKNKQKHLDLHDIGESFKSYPNIPQTFDGSIPCYAFNKDLQRIIIGQKYFFDKVDADGLMATVTSACVDIAQKKMHLGLYTDDQKSGILSIDMADDEIRDYKEYGDSFFGSSQQSSSKALNNPYEMFEWHHDVYKHSTKEKLLEFLQSHPSINDFRKMSQKDLALIYCDLLVADAIRREGETLK
jgi:hypothetical protein